MAPKKGASKKKRVKSKNGKEKGDKLANEADVILKKDDLHVMYLQRINQWMLSNLGRAIDVFRKFDKNSDGVLTYDEFFSGMRDLDAPFTNLELMVLAKIIDTDCDKAIDYIEFSNGVKYERPVKYLKDDGLPAINIIREKFENCPQCLIKRWNYNENKNPRYIRLEVQHEVMLKVDSYPGHFHALLHAHTYIHGIKDTIKQLHNNAFTKINIYSKDEDKIFMLEDQKTLQESGYEGGSSKEDCQKVLLYYDFDISNIDCPILTCDYYFHRDK